ncbi:hypothetical protein AB0E10_39990 [Streptomyces sp. NPDC048045]|uniref:hypothetical protein n=1 Tax=Streptomyces sp. NPDC048045 TaxID=3154710 RepID=UPI0034328EE0
MVRDALYVAERVPWSFPDFDSCDRESGNVRSAPVGQLTVVYWINRPNAGRLCILDLV